MQGKNEFERTVLKFIETQLEFNKRNDERWERQEKFNQILLSLPTIKKEIKVLKINK